MEKQSSRWLEAIGLHRKELRSWAMYDWANSAFATTMMATVLPIFFADVAAAHLDPAARTAAWGYIQAIGLAIVAMMSPILGAIADFKGNRKLMVAVFMLIGAAGCGLMALVEKEQIFFAGMLTILGSVGFAGSLVFYEAILPHITDAKEVDRVSTSGYALGYIGGGVLLALNLAWILSPQTFGFADAGVAVRASFISVAAWWILFSIPFFKGVREPPRMVGENESANQGSLLVGVKRLVDTLREMRQYKQIAIFLVAYLLYSDGIGTIMKMATIYGREIGIGQKDLIGALLLVQFVGIPVTFAWGPIAAKIGVRPAINLTLLGYATICVIGYFMTAGWQFWILACCVAFVQGGSQALSRSLFATLVPKAQASEFFGFFSFSSKIAGIIGPAIFGILGSQVGSSRISILSLVILFVAGIVILKFVDIEGGQALARAKDKEFHAK